MGPGAGPLRGRACRGGRPTLGRRRCAWSPSGTSGRRSRPLDDGRSRCSPISSAPRRWAARSRPMSRSSAPTRPRAGRCPTATAVTSTASRATASSPSSAIRTPTRTARRAARRAGRPGGARSSIRTGRSGAASGSPHRRPHGPASCWATRQRLSAGTTTFFIYHPISPPRLRAIATPGTVVVNDSVALLIGPAIELRLAETPLVGVPRPVEVFEVVRVLGDDHRHAGSHDRGSSTARSNSTTSTVASSWHAGSPTARAVRSSSKASPGVGKSRLLMEVLDATSAQAGRHMTLQCSPYLTTSSLRAVPKPIHRLLSIATDDTTGRRASTSWSR